MANAGLEARVRRFRELREVGIAEFAERTGLAPELLRISRVLGRRKAEICAVLCFPQ